MIDLSVFLKSAGWAGAAQEALKGDCSTRQFERLTKDGQTAILMQAAPDQKTPAFLTVGGLLRRAGLRAPAIYAAEEDADGAFVLMEDFGRDLFSGPIAAGADTAPYDTAIVEALALVHEQIAAADLAGLGLTDFTSATFAFQAAWCLDHYVAPRLSQALTDADRAAFDQAWRGVLAPLDTLPRVLILRDFIADNVMDLGGEGAMRVGFIDFQDGGPGPVAYDLMSYCEEVRRDSGPARWKRVFDAYQALHPVLSRDVLEETGRMLSVQRHVRLLGNQALQAQHNILDRLEHHVQILLRDETMGPVRDWFWDRGILRG